jgi:hypothetical protein
LESRGCWMFADSGSGAFPRRSMGTREYSIFPKTQAKK